MPKQPNQSVSAFNQDALENQGYLYSTNAPLSSRLANQRLTDVTLEYVDLRGRSVLDIGCGDGVYTTALFDRVQVGRMVGVDYAAQAIELARSRSGGRAIEYQVHSAADLPYPARSFEVAILRGVLHHLDDPTPAIREALRVADLVWVIEPNGYNPGLKILEKVSPYHREHEEKSYWPFHLDDLVKRAGGRVLRRKWAGFVPMFCPDWMAKFMKALEPAVEAIPLVRHVGCAQYNFLASAQLDLP